MPYNKQASTTHGPQQVNNGWAGGELADSTRERTRTREKNEVQQNKLLEASNGQFIGWVDTGTT